MTAEVSLEITGPVATLTFDHRARRNAMTIAMWESIPEHCDDIEAAHGIRVVVLRGAGDEAFVAGADISEFARARHGSNGAAYDLMTARATSAIAALRCPVVARIQGFCIGGGLALALAADLRYAADDATFGLPRLAWVSATRLMGWAIWWISSVRRRPSSWCSPPTGSMPAPPCGGVWSTR